MDPLRVIGEPRRREILRLVWTDELPVGEIASQRHAEPAPPGFDAVRRGWEHYLDRLQLVATGRDAGPDPNRVA